MGNIWNTIKERFLAFHSRHEHFLYGMASVFDLFGVLRPPSFRPEPIDPVAYWNKLTDKVIDEMLLEAKTDEERASLENDRQKLRDINYKFFNTKFKVLVVNGDVPLERISYYVEIWHLLDSKMPLHEYLGMTQEEYVQWVQNPNCLSEMVSKWKTPSTPCGH